jgi:putative ABC transport system permease protein
MSKGNVMFAEQWLQDIRLAGRGLLRARGFTAAAVLTLAVGIAGTTVMFALIQGVLLRPLPIPEQDRVVLAWKDLQSTGSTHSHFGDVEIDAVRTASRLFERVSGVTSNGASPWLVFEDGASSYITGALVGGEFFDVLGVMPILGRTLNRADDLENAEKVVVIAHGLWQRRYGSSRDVVGRRIVVDETPLTIVGVMPPDIGYPRGAEAWRTTGSVPISPNFGNAARREVDLIGRLRPGVSLEQATSELTLLTQQFERDLPPTAARGFTVVVRSFEEEVVGDVRVAMLLLFGAVALVLLIGNANVANLLLLRGESRRAERAVRAALGANRGRLARQVLAESLVLAVAAGAVGLLVTWWSLQALIAIVPDGLPRVDAVRIDVTVILFTVGVAFFAALLAGFAPALSGSDHDVAAHLRGGARTATAGTRHGRRALVVAQVALAVTVVGAAGLLTRSLLHLQTIDMGMAANQLVFVDVALPAAKYRGERTRHAQFLDEAIAALEADPAILAATPVNAPPFSGNAGWEVPRFAAEGQTAERAAINPALNLESIHPNYFATFGVRLVGGRYFTDADRDGTPMVAIVSADVAARTWPGEDPIGKRLKMGGADSRSEWRTVVGVVEPTRYRELEALRATLYLPARQFQMTARRLVLRTTASVAEIATTARARMRTVDAAVQVIRVASFDDLLRAPLARPRFNAFVIGIFGIAALLLSSIGLYAVLAAYVRQRSKEIGIRIAIGATAADVRGLVVGESLRLAGAGAIIGLAGTVMTSRLLRGLLFEVEPLDPVAMIAVAAVLIAAAAVATYLPVRRATRVDAVTMLRME